MRWLLVPWAPPRVLPGWTALAPLFFAAAGAGRVLAEARSWLGRRGARHGRPACRASDPHGADPQPNGRPGCCHEQGRRDLMLTKAQALTEDRFHENGSCRVWRRNGAAQTWKTRPHEWRIPVKHGFRDTGQIWHHDADRFHTESDCPHGGRS